MQGQGKIQDRNAQYKEQRKGSIALKRKRELEHNFHKYYYSSPKSHFFDLMRAQQGNCFYCGARFDGTFLITIDHLTPTVRGGVNMPENMVLSCEDCNRDKGSMSLGEYLVVRHFRWKVDFGVGPKKIICNQLQCRSFYPLPHAVNWIRLMYGKGITIMKKLALLAAALALVGCTATVGNQSNVDLLASSTRSSEHDAEYVGVPTGWGVDEFGACYPADLTFTPSPQSPRRGLAESKSMGLSRVVTITYVKSPGASHGVNSNVCAYALPQTGMVVLPINGAHLKHELGHLLGVTWHHCARVAYHPCEQHN